MHKLRSSPISCEDFSIPGGITNGVSVYQPPKGQGEARLNYCSITIILSVTHIYICFPIVSLQNDQWISMVDVPP